jgi:hypothetical protein
MTGLGQEERVQTQHTMRLHEGTSSDLVLL